MLFLLEERAQISPAPTPCERLRTGSRRPPARLEPLRKRSLVRSITGAMPFVDAYNRVTDLQQLVATLPASAPAEAAPALAPSAPRVAGASRGARWCPFFVWGAPRRAGLPPGASGRGLGSVAQITDGARRGGRLLPTGATRGAGDLILFGNRHVGMVE